MGSGPKEHDTSSEEIPDREVRRSASLVFAPALAALGA